ncbi:Ail/Lom family outer membrane beta-barrel protein [Mixta intestinalis]|uniref:Attachment invasion locus protein n=1 Tax=Mixta intestinalis TaxID=1615494 RepID=A0A6P1Q4K5_9GAMM|nr:Ail/Lom family outer membrane beta-barrel protein [Mixta intestinalis]QHM72848.1 Attachment invasion locus protein [Mixta intestinalis]
MKKISLAILLAASTVSGSALADYQSLTVGYAQSKVEDFKNIRGVNLQYRYEFDDIVGVMASFSYMKNSDLKGGKDKGYEQGIEFTRSRNADLKYYSFLVGPSFRLNDYISLYALGGLAYTKAEVNNTWNISNFYEWETHSSKKSSAFAYGLGVIINPVEAISITLGYEGTETDFGQKYSVNGFNIGLGYNF